MILCGALAVAATGAASAQLKPEVQTGSLIPVQPQAVEAARAGEVRKGFARCIYRNAPRKAVALLEHSDPQRVDLAAAGLKNVSADLGMERCLSAEVGSGQSALGMKFPPAVLRDLLAEEAYLAANRTVPPTPTGDLSMASSHYVSTDDALAKAQAIAAFTDCTVTTDVVHADGLLRTMPGSIVEHSAAQALAPSLGGCLVQGQEFKLTPGSIRALLAYAMWNRFARGVGQ